MPEGVEVGLLLGALAIGFTVATLIDALFLRAAVALYNMVATLNDRMAGDASFPSRVPQPTVGEAWWISFQISVARILVGGLIFGLFRDDENARGRIVDSVAQLLFVPISLLITVGVLSAKLPTTFVRAILITLFDILLVVLVVGVLVGIAVLVFGVALMGA
jgi:hypothetical protein